MELLVEVFGPVELTNIAPAQEPMNLTDTTPGSVGAQLHNRYRFLGDDLNHDVVAIFGGYPFEGATEGMRCICFPVFEIGPRGGAQWSVSGTDRDGENCIHICGGDRANPRDELVRADEYKVRLVAPS